MSPISNQSRNWTILLSVVQAPRGADCHRHGRCQAGPAGALISPSRLLVFGVLIHLQSPRAYKKTGESQESFDPLNGSQQLYLFKESQSLLSRLKTESKIG